MIYIVDNYDSFVYNIMHTINYPSNQIIIRRNDQIEMDEIMQKKVSAVIISPGPMSPDKAGMSNEVIKVCAKIRKPLLGICLGHQCIGQVFDCIVTHYKNPTHGKKSEILLKESPLFEGLGTKIEAGRYHSLYVAAERFNHQKLLITASLEDGTIMGISHRELPIFGVQFHPESILTKSVGTIIFDNFLKLAGIDKNI